MTEAVIWLVVWVILAGAGMWLSVAIFGFIGVGLAGGLDSMWLAPAGVIIGWLIGVAWLIFAAVQVILQIVSVVQLATQ